MKKTILSAILGSFISAGAAFAGVSYSVSDDASLVSGLEQSIAQPKTCRPTSGLLGSNVKGNLTTGYDAKHYFRGLEVGDSTDLVSTGASLSFGLSDSTDLTVGTWYGSQWSNDYDELDIYANITQNIGNFFVGLGATHFRYSGDGDDTTEISGLAGVNLGDLTLSLLHAYDFDFEGHYSQLKAAYSQKLCNVSSLDFSAGISYLQDYWINGDGLGSVDLYLGLPIKLTKNASLVPHATYIIPVDKLADAGEDEALFGGVNLSVNF